MKSTFVSRQIRCLLCICAELSGVLHQCHVLASEMVHFIHQMQYYITFEVCPSVCYLFLVSRSNTWAVLLIVLCACHCRCWNVLGMSCGIRSSKLRIWIILLQLMRFSWTLSFLAACWMRTTGYDALMRGDCVPVVIPCTCPHFRNSIVLSLSRSLCVCVCVCSLCWISCVQCLIRSLSSRTLRTHCTALL